MLSFVTSKKYTTQDLSKLIGEPEELIIEFFGKFELNSTIPIYKTLIEDLSDIFLPTLCNNAFSNLLIYKDTDEFIKKFIPYLQGLKSGSKNPPKYNAIDNFTKQPIAACILMLNRHEPETYKQLNLFRRLLVLAIMSTTKKTTEDKRYIKNAAIKIRTTFEKKQNVGLISTLEHNNTLYKFHEKSKTINSFQALCGLIRVFEQENHPESNRLFKNISNILPLIDREQHFESEISWKTYKSSQDLIQELKTTTLKQHSNIDEPEPFFLFSDTRPDLYDLNDEPLIEEILNSTDPSEIMDFKRDLDLGKLDQEVTAHERTIKLHAYVETDHLRYVTNLFNPIERRWLTKALISTDTDDVTSLVIALSICMNIEHREILKLKIGNDERILPNGFIRIKVPNAENAAIPDKKNTYLYTKHINDCESHNFVYLPLPNFVRNIIQNFNISSSTQILNLYDNPNSAKHSVTDFMKILRKKHGQRFNTNRISCQLAQYIKSEENDPSLSFALFGNSVQRAPSEYYYRSIRVELLIRKYKQHSENYFNAN